MEPRRTRHQKNRNIVATEWPLTTTSQLADSLKLEGMPEGDVNQSLLRLMLARKAIGDAKLALHAAKLVNKEKPAVLLRLEELIVTMDEATRRFPLTIAGMPEQKPRWRLEIKEGVLDPALAIS